MKLFAISDIHGATKPIEAAAALIRAADGVVVSGDITRGKTRSEAEEVVACIEQYSTRILAVHGNWDRPEVMTFLEDKGYSLHGTGRTLDGTGFFGLGGSSPTPIHTATEYTEKDIDGLLRVGYQTVHEAARTVLVSHVPPRGVRDRSFLGLRGGSHSLKRFLETHPVSLCLCGHIHEAAGIERFRDTLVANAGSFKRGHYLTVELGHTITVTAGRVAH